MRLPLQVAPVPVFPVRVVAPVPVDCPARRSMMPPHGRPVRRWVRRSKTRLRSPCPVPEAPVVVAQAEPVQAVLVPVAVVRPVVAQVVPVAVQPVVVAAAVQPVAAVLVRAAVVRPVVAQVAPVVAAQPAEEALVVVRPVVAVLGPAGPVRAVPVVAVRPVVQVPLVVDPQAVAQVLPVAARPEAPAA
ncbi:hypothetical protein [Mycolicibacterium bacteremicum]|uniref:Uncharacterized protein n=1 Tax=Mycolicibacterium bacteremicum TaxID=564198 RepID=A0A1W9YYX2_MYCBA|nr:hypothetical protein [Mycolicibacterium bacteremicum]MCV7431442.1 hypothetical protein [Mycolicibacterium bacteremicum]ORA05197.1 hypothetical protein BST17_11125 [Mycolicibacterium bacteremicum]